LIVDLISEVELDDFQFWKHKAIKKEKKKLQKSIGNMKKSQSRERVQ